MPYRDPEQRRAVQRESQRRRRAGGGDRTPRPSTPSPELAELRYATAAEVVELLDGQCRALLDDAALKTAERARVIAYVAGVLLRAVELSDLAARVEALERRFSDDSAEEVLQ